MRAPKKSANSEMPVPPKGGVAIRMYRIGHGDCFLLAFDGNEKPVYVLVDCGYKPGSPSFIKTLPDAVVADIRAVTKNVLDVVIITHEHQDHLNAITKQRFQGITIRQVWLAWTESDSDPLAKRLRQKHGDMLKALTIAQQRLAAAGEGKASVLANYLALEVGGEDSEVAPSGELAAPSWTNKHALKFLRDRSEAEVRLLYPHEEVTVLTGADNVRLLVLGPPYDEASIGDMLPRAGESFPSDGGLSPPLASFASALRDATNGLIKGQPFSPRRSIPLDATSSEPEVDAWYESVYGSGGADPVWTDEVAGNAVFRRIETDWLLAAEHLALSMGNDTNNSSLVLAFELGKGGKVLLFAGDAQRGSWASWATKRIPDGDEEVDVRDLLGRTVLYKVAHHGSHNATLNGSPSADTPNLMWLGKGQHSDEFTAMITAVRAWATQPKVGWDHPLPSIRAALLEKTDGRLFQTDIDFSAMQPQHRAGGRSWNSFKARASGTSLFFDYLIRPD